MSRHPTAHSVPKTPSGLGAERAERTRNRKYQTPVDTRCRTRNPGIRQKSQRVCCGGADCFWPARTLPRLAPSSMSSSLSLPNPHDRPTPFAPPIPSPVVLIPVLIPVMPRFVFSLPGCPDMLPCLANGPVCSKAVSHDASKVWRAMNRGSKAALFVPLDDRSAGEWSAMVKWASKFLR